MTAMTNEAVTASHNPDLVSLVKDYALFLFRKGDAYTVPVDASFDAGDHKPVGYNSEDGAVLHPEAGDSTDFNGHNGDIVKSTTAPGYWTLQLTGIECRRSMAEAYFGVEIGENGAIHVDSASNNTEWSIVLVGITDAGDPIVLSAERAQISEREDITLVSTELVSFGVTFKLFKPTGEGKHMFSLYGLFAAEDRAAAVTPSAKTVASVSVAGETEVGVDDMIQLSAQALWSDGSTTSVTEAATWTSGSTDKASVEAGLVTGIAAGTSDITAVYQGVVSAAHTVTVNAGE